MRQDFFTRNQPEVKLKLALLSALLATLATLETLANGWPKYKL
jgi:hypothetical protein